MDKTILVGGANWLEVNEKIEEIRKIDKWYKTAEEFLESREPKPLWINDGNGNILISPAKLHQFMSEYAEYISKESQKEREK